MCTCTSEVWSFGPSRNDGVNNFRNDETEGSGRVEHALCLSPHGVAHAGGKGVGQGLAEQLLDEIARIEKSAVFEDASAAQREEFRDLEPHDPVIATLAQTKAL